LQLSIELATDFNKTVSRGQKIDLNLLVKDPDGNPVEGAELSLLDAAGNSIDLNSVGNGFYLGEYTVPVDLPLGKQSISLSASKAGLSGLEQLSLQIKEGRISAVLLQPAEPKAMVGEKLEFKFKLVYDDGSPVESADANAVLNNVSIPLVLDEATGVFTGHYVFSETDLEQAMLVVSAEDSLGNKGTTSLSFSVQQPLPLVFIAVAVALIVAALLAFYGLKRTHKLSSLLQRSGMISLSKKKKQLQKAIAKEKKEIAALEKGIAEHEKDLRAVREEIKVERKKQALAMKRLPAESKYAAHKTAVGLSAKIKRLFVKPKVSPKEIQVQKRLQKIDQDVAKLREMVQNLESEYCKQTIKEDFFRQKLFDYREKIHLLELERKKIE
jgi:cell division protein FtsB